MNTFEKLYNALFYEVPEIFIPIEIQDRAYNSLKNMLQLPN